ncbi:MAG: glycosyltransferase 87 family protein [Ktedonobacterales bacterium]
MDTEGAISASALKGGSTDADGTKVPGQTTIVTSPSTTAMLIRLLALASIGALTAPIYLALMPLAEATDRSGGALAGGLLWPLMGLTALMVAAVALVWRTQPAATRNWRWVELGLILLVGVVLRAEVFGAPLALSRDAYRYAWDAQLLAHGLSPYTHTPLDPALAPLRDTHIWPNLRFRTVPTLYPPGAQALYLLAHLVAPLNIYGIKAAMVVCDALSGLLTLALLRRRSLDLRRVILYWWAPIPIVEFAYSAHVDAAAILWTLAALLVNGQRWRGTRFLTGVLLGLATLTKLYPLLFVVALIRRRDYSLLAGLLLTVALGYAPFVALGLGGGGFLGTYLSQRFIDQGILLQWLSLLVTLFTWSPPVLVFSEMAALAVLALGVLLARWRLGLTPEAGVLVLSAAWVLLAPHLFPWYVAALLPFVALFLGRPHPHSLIPNLSPARRGERKGFVAEWRIPQTAPAFALAFWLFTLAMPFTYVIFAPGYPAGLFQWFFLAPFAVAATPLLTAEGRQHLVETLRRLFAPPTADELRRCWQAWFPTIRLSALSFPRREGAGG